MTALSFENTNTGSTKLQYDDTSVNDYVVTLPHKTCTVAGMDDVANSSSLLATYTVSGMAVTSIDFSGLDINAHKSYRVEIDLIAGTATGGNLSVYINGNATATNYYTQYTSFTATTVSTSIPNNSVFITIPPALNGVLQANGIVSKAGKLKFDSTHSNIFHTLAMVNASNILPANITQLTFVSSVAGNIGIGSTIRIYRGDV